MLVTDAVATTLTKLARRRTQRRHAQASFANTGPRESPELHESTAPLRKARARAQRGPSARRARAARARPAGRAADGAVGGMARSQLGRRVDAHSFSSTNRRCSAIGETPSEWASRCGSYGTRICRCLKRAQPRSRNQCCGSTSSLPRHRDPGVEPGKPRQSSQNAPSSSIGSSTDPQALTIPLGVTAIP